MSPHPVSLPCLTLPCEPPPSGFTHSLTPPSWLAWHWNGAAVFSITYSAGCCLIGDSTMVSTTASMSRTYSAQRMDQDVLTASVQTLQDFTTLGTCWPLGLAVERVDPDLVGRWGPSRLRRCWCLTHWFMLGDGRTSFCDVFPIRYVSSWPQNIGRMPPPLSVLCSA